MMLRTSLLIFSLLFMAFNFKVFSEDNSVDLEACIELLGSDDYEEREEASEWIVKHLNKEGQKVVDKLKDTALKSDVREVKFRCVKILKSVSASKFVIPSFKALEELANSKNMVAQEAKNSLEVFVRRFFKSEQPGYELQFTAEIKKSFPFSYISYLKEPVSLYVEGMSFTDDEVMVLGELDTLEAIQFKSVDFSITEKGFKTLRNMVKLNRLAFKKCKNTALTAKGFIQSRRSFDELTMMHCIFDEGELDFLKKLKYLRSLDLAMTNVDDEMMKTISQVMITYELGLWKTKVTDKSVPEIIKIKNLRSLNLDVTAVTANGEADIKAGFSFITISRRKVFLGIYVDHEFNGTGVKVDRVIEDSVAETVGLKKADIVVGMNGKKIETSDGIFAILTQLKSEAEVKSVSVKRDGKTIKLNHHPKK